MILRASRLGIWLLLAACCHAAGPDWLTTALAANNPPWLPNDGAVRLVDFNQTRYTAPKHSVLLVRGAIHVANEAGLPQALGFLVYNADSGHIISASAWVVSPDGKKTRSYRRSDFTDSVVQFNQYYWDAQRVIEFNGASRVEIGGTVAWEIQADQDQGIEELNAQFEPVIPVARTVLEVIPPPGEKLDWYTQIPDLQATAGSVPGAVHWELTHQRNLPKGRPNGFLRDPRVIFVRCIPIATEAHTRTWADFSQFAARITEPRMDAGSAVKAQAAALVAGKTDRWERIRALTEFVQREIAYLAITLDRDSLAGLRPHPPAEVLRNRYGDCKDKATLLVSMLRAIGEDGRLIVLQPGNPRAVNPAWPSNQFNHMIAAIPADAATPGWWPTIEAGPAGKMVVFDPTDATTPLGILSPADQGGSALVIDPAGGALVQLPPTAVEHSGVSRKIEATLDAQGGLAVTIDERRAGVAAALAYGARWGLPKEQFQTILEQRVQERNPLVRNLAWSDDWQAAQATYLLHFSFGTPSYAHLMGGGLLLLDPNILPDPVRLAPWTSKEQGSSWLEADAVNDQTRVTLPAGCTVEELPDPWGDEGENVSGRLSYRQEGNAVIFERQVTRRAKFYEKADYDAIRSFYQKLLEAERRPIVLRSAAPS